jgi:GWxTD domain-containing protein
MTFMRRIPAAAVYLGILCSMASSCAFSGRSEPSPAARELRLALSAIAESRDLRAFDRAERQGPDSVRTFLDRFWAERDPTPDTERNEYRQRFELRIERAREALTPPGRDRADDRLIAYLRYGLPAAADSMRFVRGTTYVGWMYLPAPDVSLAGFGHPLLDELDFVASFERNDAEVHKLVPWPGRRRWRRPPGPLGPSDIEDLESILTDQSKDRYLRAAAAWRLRGDPGVEPFAVLLKAAHDSDQHVASVISEAIEPLAAVRLASGERVVAVRGEGGLVDRPEATVPQVRQPGPLSGPAPAGTDRLRWALFANRIYDPTTYLSPQAVSSLREVASNGDSLLTAHGWLTDEEVERVFQGPLLNARHLLDAGEAVGAHRLLDPLLKRELSGNPEAWHLDALALLESATPGGRQLAEERVREALRLDPGNVRYHITLARIMARRTLDRYADRQLDEVIAELPIAADAYAVKARMRLEVYWALGWKAAGWATPVSEQGMRTDVALAEALDLLNRALVVDSDNALATWWLGTNYLMSEEWSAAIPVMSYLVREGVHVPEALLGRGLAFQHLGELEMAWRDYLQGISLLPESVRPLAVDPRWVLPPSAGGLTHQRAGDSPGMAAPGSLEAGRAATRTIDPATSDSSAVAARRRAFQGATPDSAVGRYWNSRDPLFATELNERLVEQLRRFAYVTWHFAVPNLGLRGWDTHRGRVYLRYGEPGQMATQAPNLRDMIDPVADSGGGAEGMASAAALRDKAFGMLDAVKETWRYEDMTFTFGGGMTSGNMTLWPSPFPEDIGTRAAFDDLAERIPESVKVEGHREVRDIEASWYRFVGSGGSVELVPVARLIPPQDDLAGSYRSIAGSPVHLLVLDDGWKAITRQEAALPNTFRVTGVATTWVGPLLRFDPASVPGTPQFAALEVIPPGEGPAFAARDTLVDIDPGGLRISSLVLATNVTEESRAERWPQGSHFRRFGNAIVPRPDGLFEVNEPVFIYAEVYGLTKDEIGATDYEIAYTITALDRRRTLAPMITPLLGRQVTREDREGSVTTVFSRSDIFSRTYEQLRIVFPEGDYAHRYMLTVEIRDRVGGESVSRRVPVQLRGR